MGNLAIIKEDSHEVRNRDLTVYNNSIKLGQVALMEGSRGKVCQVKRDSARPKQDHY